MNESSLVRDSIRAFEGPRYGDLPDGIIRMNDNSNLFASNPAIGRAREDFDFSSLSSYPSVASDGLRAAIGEKLGIDRSQIIVGNGSDEVIDLSVKAFLDPGEKAALMTPTFEMYTNYIKIMSGQVAECRLKEESFDIDVDRILAARPKMIFLCTPNNPTGNRFSREDILRLVEDSKSLVVIDEAYFQFSGRPSDVIDLPGIHDNVLILRTFSKAYGLAGLRTGFGIGSKAVISPMRKICAPFRLNRFSERVAIEAIADDKFIEEMARMAREERLWLSEELSKLGVRVFPSEANFLLFRSPAPLKTILAKLIERGIAIRDCSRQPLLEECARVTLGSRELNARFGDAMKGILEEIG